MVMFPMHLSRLILSWWLVDLNAGSQEGSAEALAVGCDQAFLSGCQVLVAPIYCEGHRLVFLFEL